MRDGAIRDKLVALTQYERDKLLERAMKHSDESRLARGKLGPHRFTLVGGPDFGALVKSTGSDAMENHINEMLAKGIG